LLGEAGRHRADSQKPELLTMTEQYDDSSDSARFNRPCPYKRRQSRGHSGYTQHFIVEALTAAFEAGGLNEVKASSARKAGQVTKDLTL
jgi:hypothetical protein